MKFPFIPSLCVALALATNANAQLRIQPGDVEDKRTTGDSFFGGLEVKLKLLGDDLADAQSIRTVVKTAVDDTGRDLVDAKKEKGEFEKIRSSGQSTTVTLRLKNPARKATAIKELSGETELFVPKNDPDSIVKVEDFQKSGGSPIVSPALAAAGIEVTTYNKDQIDAAKAKKEKEKKDKKDPNANLNDAMAEAFGGIFGMRGGPNDITLQIKDPNKKLVDIEFQDANGKTIETNGSSSWGDGDKEMKTCDFRSALPAGTRLVIYLSTPKSMVSTPFSLKDVFLP